MVHVFHNEVAMFLLLGQAIFTVRFTIGAVHPMSPFSHGKLGTPSTPTFEEVPLRQKLTPDVQIQ
jgi:hypothetical protein